VKKNATSVLQPLDQGILQNMDLLYMKRLLRLVLSSIDDVETVSAECVSKAVTVLDAVHFVNSAVKGITLMCVEKCFVKAGIPITSAHGEIMRAA